MGGLPLRLAPLCGTENSLCLLGSPDRDRGCPKGCTAPPDPQHVSNPCSAAPLSWPCPVQLRGSEPGGGTRRSPLSFLSDGLEMGAEVNIRNTRRGTWKRCYFYFLRQLGLLHLEPSGPSGRSRLLPLCRAFPGAQSVERHKQVPCKEAAGERRLFSPEGHTFCLRRATYMDVAAAGRGLGVGFHRLSVGG